MPRSIRVTFLFWYGLLFVLLIAAFGVAAYLGLRRTTYRAIDARLESQAQLVAAAVEEMVDGSVDVELPRAARRQFGDAEGAPYFAVWDRDGALRKRSGGRDIERPRAPGKRAHGSRREIVVEGPAQSLVLVGKRIRDELEDLREFLAALLTAGLGVAVAGLAGGWWLAGRALRPIGRISRAAAAVSGANLAERIDVAQTESELGQLAAILNQTFDRLQKAFEAQARFTADASHELRTPLSVILTSAELALRKERSPQEYREAMDAVHAAALRMKSLVEGLLTLARSDARAALRKERTDLAALLGDAATRIAPLAAERGVQVKVEAAPLEASVDRDRIREAIDNLVANAVRYTPSGGRVDLTAAVEGAQVLLRVADSGIGIPEQDRPRVFERFFRSDAARSRDAGGAGLGLAIARGIVEAHGGSISFTSREGSGTTFEIRLPA